MHQQPEKIPEQTRQLKNSLFTATCKDPESRFLILVIVLKTWLLVLALSFYALVSFSQVAIKGIVRDQQINLPLPGENFRNLPSQLFTQKTIKMHTHKNRLKNFFLMPVMLLTIVSGCKKEVDATLPSDQISESELLVIPAAIALPANLPNGNNRAATYFAEGVQKYKSQAKAGSNPVTYEWIFVAPRADLYDATNAKVGTHSAGPTWQLFGSADSIHGQQFTPVKSSPSLNASIDWLQLMPKTGKIPTGIFANVQYIQRIATTGGKAPITLPLNVNDTVDVKYTAIYRFTRQNL